MYNAEGFALHNVYDAPKKHDKHLRPGSSAFSCPLRTFFDLLHSTSERCAHGQQAALPVVAALPRRHARADAARGHGEVAPVRVIFHVAARVRDRTARQHLQTHRYAPPVPLRTLITSSVAHQHTPRTEQPSCPPPLTTCLALCRAFRRLASTSISLEKIFLNVPSLRTSEWLAVRAAAHFVGMLEHIGKVCQHERGAVEATVPRLYM